MGSGIEQRITERIIVNQKVEIISDNRVTPALIENISCHGLYVIAPCSGKEVSLLPRTIHELRFKPLNERPFSVICNVKWSYKTPPYGLTSSVGMEVLHKTTAYNKYLKSLLIDIINPSPKYREIFTTLS